jgi:hypothetical protein
VISLYHNFGCRKILPQICLVMLLFCVKISAQGILLEEPAAKPAEPPKQSTVSPKPAKSSRFNFSMPHYIVKNNLSKLSYYSQQRYLNTQEPLETIFMRINEFPEEVKMRMVTLTFAGISAQESFRICRRYLSRHHIDFFYPSLSGLNLFYTLRPMRSKLLFRLASPVDRSYGVQHGAFTVYLQQTQYSTQHLLYFRIKPQLQIFTLHSEYISLAFYGGGISWYSKNVLLCSSLLLNSKNEHDLRLALILNIIIGPSNSF